MFRFLLLPCALCLLSCAPSWAQSADNGRSPFVPMLKLELLDEKFAIGAREGDAAHEARFRVTATTGGMRAGDGTWGEKMVGFRVPIPQIVSGGAGIFGVAGDNSASAPRVVMTQPLTDENGVALGKVVSGMRLDNVVLAYPNTTAEERVEIEAAWNELDFAKAWSQPRFLRLGRAHEVTYRMSYQRAEKWLPIRGHKMEFLTSALAGRLWRRDYGPDLDRDGRPDGDYIYANFVLSDADEIALAGTLSRADAARFTRWQPRFVSGKEGAYTSALTPLADSRFVVDAVRTQLWDSTAYEATGGVSADNSPRALQPRPLRLEKIGPAAPVAWNRATVARLLRDIEKPRSAALLRGLYFGAAGAPELPVKEGWQLLDAAAKAAKPASRRWFLLMSVRGFAGLRAPGVPPSAGFSAYRALFGAAAQAPAVRAQTIVRAALADFVNAAPVGYDQYQLSDEKGDNATIIAAWKAYSQSQKWPQNAAERADEPLWSLRWQEESLPTDLVLYIARQSKSWKDAPLDWRFAAAAALSTGNQQGAAFSLWQPLKDELGKDDLDRLNIAYDRLIELAGFVAPTQPLPRPVPGVTRTRNVNFEQRTRRRLNLAQERTDRWDFGWAERLEMAPDGAAQMRIARQLLARPDNARTRDETMRSLRAMFRLAFDIPSDISFDRGAANATGVLARGLLARPALTREQQWQTRFILSGLLQRLKRRPEAAEVLAAPFGQPANAEETELLERVQMARRAIAS